MALTYTLGADPSFSYSDYISSLQGIMNPSSTITAQSPDTFTLSNGAGLSVTLSGTGFTYTIVAGITVLSGGTVADIAVSQGGIVVGTLEINEPATTLTTALLDEVFGVDPLAIENLILPQDYNIVGTNGADSVDAGLFFANPIAPDGVAYVPTGVIQFLLGGGADVFQGSDGADIVYGGFGWDNIKGGDGDDLIFGENGYDVLFGGAGVDALYGGNGKDSIRGGNDDDIVDGGNNNDKLWGDAGNDVINGGGGNDKLYGGVGNDELIGGWGNDTLSAGAGDDRLFGGGGADIMNGNNGDDLIDGGTGSDAVRGGGGNDVILGGGGNDNLFGGAGSDTISGGVGRDKMAGDGGADTFVFGDGDGADLVRDFNVSEDLLDLTGIFIPLGDDLIFANPYEAFASQVDADVVFDFGNGDTLTLQNTSLEGLSDANFVFGEFIELIPEVLG